MKIFGSLFKIFHGQLSQYVQLFARNLGLHIDVEAF